MLGNSLRIRRYLDDFPVQIIKNVWTDTGRSGFGDRQRYVVQTNIKAVERCLLMSTDPGDLVLDPTCGAGTTAVAAEKHGRRWITIDTSRVALAIAREWLLTVVFDYYVLRDPSRGVDGGFEYETVKRIQPSQLAAGSAPEQVPVLNQPKVERRKKRVSGPFTVEALSRYAANPLDEPPAEESAPAADHVKTLLEALQVQGIPRPGSKPLKIRSLTALAATGPLQAEGVTDLSKRAARFAVAVGPQFGAITMAQVSDALRDAIGFDLVVFVGFAVSADAQEKLGRGRIGSTDVALLLASPDLLLGDLLKTTQASQTFRLYASPDVSIEHSTDGYRVTLEAVDSFDAATGKTKSFGRSGIQAWFLDDDFDGNLFRVAQAFFPVTNAWERLQRALKTIVDPELVDRLHGWTSLPFDVGEHHRIAVRVVTDDGNEAEVVLDLPEAAA